MSCCRFGLKEVWDLKVMWPGHPVVCICDCDKGALRREAFPHWETMKKVKYTESEPLPEHYAKLRCETLYFEDHEKHIKQIEDIQEKFGSETVRNWYRKWKERQKK